MQKRGAVTDNWIPLAIIVNILVGLFIFFFYDKFKSSGKPEDDLIPGKSKTRVYLSLVPALIISVLVTVIVHILKHYYR